MSRRTLPRATFSLLVISISMLPLSAHAAPAPAHRSESAVARTMDLSRIATRTMGDLFRLLTGADAPPPGQQNREGTGIDPHGGGPGHP
jgi:hypothetical protein